MATLPRYGGSNSVTELDIGQPGGTLNGAGQARAVLRAYQQRAAFLQTITRLPQQAPAFHDIQGPGTTRYRWEGTIRVSSSAIIATIVSNLELALTGYPFSAVTGGYGEFDPAEINATQLKDSFDNFHARRARIVDYSLGRWTRITSGTWAYLTDFSATFARLG